MNSPVKNVCVVVLGDIGRSPRMQYHSLSLAEQGHKVDIVGYGETKPFDSIQVQPLVNYHYLTPYPNISCPRLLNYFFKTLWQAFTLFFLLLIIRKADIVIVQNPPAVPSLLICWFYCIIMRAKLIVDWHNYAHSIMALKVGLNHPLVKMTKKIESFVGRRAVNFCVTNSMKKDLEEKWGIRATTLYDRPPEIFQSISLKEKHEILNRLALKYDLLSDAVDDNTAFTEVKSTGEIVLKNNRPGLLISSTSWTEDEDFSVLLQALQEYEDHYCDGNFKKLPELICIITGKGPLKEYYCNKIKASTWKHVKVITPWLESVDYPVLLACADLGVCLHTSSSGLDLPMKVVDMFGCGVPVCAYDFKCLDELIQHAKNSYKFKNSDDLSHQLQQWFEDFPNNTKQNEINESFKSQLQSFQNVRWRENWNKIALPLFK